MTTIRLFLLSGAMLLALGSAGAQASSEIMCPMIYKPVCAVGAGGHHATYSNRCVALRAGAFVRHEGVCRPRRH